MIVEAITVRFTQMYLTLSSLHKSHHDNESLRSKQKYSDSIAISFEYLEIVDIILSYLFSILQQLKKLNR